MLRWIVVQLDTAGLREVVIGAGAVFDTRRMKY
jgi:hypothetical protein